MLKEIALTKGRHEIISPITGEEVTESFFGTVVEDVLNVEQHMGTVERYLDSISQYDTLVVYVTGLTPLFQAVFAMWIWNHCDGPDRNLDFHPGRLVFAHYDRDAGSYVFLDALRGEAFDPKWVLKTS